MTVHAIQSAQDRDMTSVDQLAEEMDVSKPTISRWQQRGWLNSVRIGGRKYFTRNQLDTFVRRAEAGEFAGR
jgi:excisionase family DNA binding protein